MANFTSWRGDVGVIKPTMRPGSLEELIRMLPEGIGVLPLFLDIQRGTADEFADVMAAYEVKVAQLAEQKVDLIHPEGAPPFMVKGYRGEGEIIAGWEKKYKIPIFTSGTNHIAALKALKIKQFIGVSYLGGTLNRTFADYFNDAGFEVLAMEGIEVPFEDAGKLSPLQVYSHIKRSFLAHPGAEGIYLLGSAWRVLDIIETLEQDLQVPVVHPVTARCWEIQKRLYVREPIAGYGRLVAELP